jgi:hypothetical protein
MAVMPAPRTCAICVEPIRGVVHMEMIDGVGPFALGSCCCTVPPRKRGRPRQETASEKTADARAYRAKLRDLGLCFNGMNHGPRTHGVFCFNCSERSKRNSIARRLKKLGIERSPEITNSLKRAA